MTTEYTIQAADNGMMVSGEEMVLAIENTHIINGTDYDNSSTSWASCSTATSSTQ